MKENELFELLKAEVDNEQLQFDENDIFASLNANLTTYSYQYCLISNSFLEEKKFK